MLVSMKDMLQHALRDGYAVGQFNINNLEWVGAVLSTAQQCRSPVILGVSGGTVKHMLGLKCIHDIVVNAMTAAISIEKKGFGNRCRTWRSSTTR